MQADEGGRYVVFCMCIYVTICVCVYMCMCLYTGLVYWTEMRADEGGRYVVCSAPKPGSPVTAWTPVEYSARTLVHEYGGGACHVHDKRVYFSNFTDQQIYVQTEAGAAPSPITPDGKGLRYADACFSEKVSTSCQCIKVIQLFKVILMYKSDATCTVLKLILMFKVILLF